jgi:hypothetical protein
MTTTHRIYGPSWFSSSTPPCVVGGIATKRGRFFFAPTGTTADTKRLLAQQESHSERQWEQVAEVTENPPAHAPRQPSRALKNRHGNRHAGNLTAQNGAA